MPLSESASHGRYVDCPRHAGVMHRAEDVLGPFDVDAAQLLPTGAAQGNEPSVGYHGIGIREPSRERLALAQVSASQLDAALGERR